MSLTTGLDFYYTSRQIESSPARRCVFIPPSRY